MAQQMVTTKTSTPAITSEPTQKMLGPLGTGRVTISLEGFTEDSSASTSGKLTSKAFVTVGSFVMVFGGCDAKSVACVGDVGSSFSRLTVADCAMYSSRTGGGDVIFGFGLQASGFLPRLVEQRRHAPSFSK